MGDRLSFRLIQPRSRPFSRDSQPSPRRHQPPMNTGEHPCTHPITPPTQLESVWGPCLYHSPPAARRTGAAVRAPVPEGRSRGPTASLAAPGSGRGVDQESRGGRHPQGPTRTNALTCAGVKCTWSEIFPHIIRDEEVVGSNPATPTAKSQVRSGTERSVPGLPRSPGLSGEILEKILESVSGSAPASELSTTHPERPRASRDSWSGEVSPGAIGTQHASARLAAPRPRAGMPGHGSATTGTGRSSRLPRPGYCPVAAGRKSHVAKPERRQ